MKKSIKLAVPHMGGKEREYIDQAFKSNWIAPLGDQVDKFEEEVSEYIGMKSALATASGTAAIHLALIALEVGPGDIVFCSSLTFVASANPIVYQGARPVFIDSEPESFNMSPIALEKAFKTHKPKAVVVVNLYGQSADMDAIKELCDKHGVPIVEDAAESLGATYRGKMSGSFGKFGIFSFNGNKIITSSGGGMLVSDDTELIEKAKFWSTQAKDKANHYQHSELGFNYRLSNVSAAIGRGQLRVLEERIKQKKNIYDTYKKEFMGIDEIEMMPICDYGQPNYWLSVLTLKHSCDKNPVELMNALEAEDIESRPIWKPMHIQPFYSDCEFFSHNSSGLSVSEDIFNRGLCLPSDTHMEEKDIMRVIDVIKKELKK